MTSLYAHGFSPATASDWCGNHAYDYVIALALSGGFPAISANWYVTDVALDDTDQLLQRNEI